jgi:heme exporter protein A
MVKWDGVTIRDNHQSFRADLVWLSHRVGFKGDLNILENLKFESGLRASDQTRLGEVLERLSLSRLVGLPFRSLSAGQQRRVAKAGQALVTELIGEHIRAGGSCMVASHQPLEVDGHTRRVVLQ